MQSNPNNSNLLYNIQKTKLIYFPLYNKTTIISSRPITTYLNEKNQHLNEHFLTIK